ncbi:putative ferric-chelate reductase 1 [Latimeria chalumnae]|uniref:putative ferric-chelate reductase 1 n=1 Tax=Latimeria chalumnae TaxID=7897 RepID=UPI00313B2E42
MRKQMCKITYRVFLFCGMLLASVSGYSNGKVSIVCTSMVPDHEATPQVVTAPYNISASQAIYIPGDEITGIFFYPFLLTLQADSGQIFMGFLLQARAVGEDTILGTFKIINSDTQTLSCSNMQNAAVSHTSSSNKQRIQAVWVAPSSNKDIEFSATFVKNFKEYWVKVKGPTITRTNIPDNRLSHTCLQFQFQISSNGCGVTKLCFSKIPACNLITDQDCYFMSSTAVGSDGLQLEMSGRTNGYVAIGFSDDTQMGNDDTYMCVKDTNGEVKVQHAFITGKSPPTLLPLELIDNISTSFNNGIVQCTFITRNQISTENRAANNFFYIFLAYGEAANGAIIKHSQIPSVTNEKVDILSFQQVSGNSNRPAIIKTHGALMLIAWMTTGSIGIIMARYFKKVAKTKVWGKDIWFQAHWFMMALTVAATITAFVLAFVSRKGWSYSGYVLQGTGAHPVLGCIVMVLSLTQPLVAVFRPAPQSSRRYIFNWFHGLNALVITVLAGTHVLTVFAATTVAAIFLGLQLIDVSPNLWLPKVMGGFVGWDALIFIILEMHLVLKNHDIIDTSDQQIKNETILLLIYISGNLVFLVALLVGIGQT